MIALCELDPVSWKRGFSYSVTYNKWGREGRPSCEITEKSETYRLWTEYKKTDKGQLLNSIVSSLVNESFLKDRFFRDCVLIPVPSFEKDTAVRKLTEKISEAFGIFIIEGNAVSSFSMNETVPLDRWEHKRRKHPVKYIADKSALEKYPEDTRFVIVDDIYDTGSTTGELSKAIASAGYTNIDIFVLCASLDAKNRMKIIKDNNVSLIRKN